MQHLHLHQHHHATVTNRCWNIGPHVSVDCDQTNIHHHLRQGVKGRLRDIIRCCLLVNCCSGDCNVMISIVWNVWQSMNHTNDHTVLSVSQTGLLTCHGLVPRCSDCGSCFQHWNLIQIRTGQCNSLTKTYLPFSGR